MEFKIIYGRSGSGKTTYIFNEIKKRIDKQNKVYIVVPEQFSYSAEKNLLNTLEENSAINAEVLTLSRMADRVIADTIGNNSTHLSKIGKNMIIYEALENSKSQMKFLTNSDKNLELAFNLITELKKHKITESMLDNAKNKIDNQYLQYKIQDAENVYKLYQERIEENYIDESDCLNLLVEHIEEVDFFNNAVIYIDEFAGFTPIEYQIIEKLCTLVKEINVTICTDSLEKVENIDDSIFYFNQITAEKLIEIAKRNGCYIEKIYLENSKKFRNNELKILEANMYSGNNYEYKDDTKNICLSVAQNPYAEIENIAEEILKLVRDTDYRFKDIAIISADIEMYSGIIKAIFEKFEIPVFIDENKDVNGNILMRFIISLLNIFTTNFSYESMFSYIKSGVLNLDENDIFLLENYVNKWGIRGNKWYKSDFSYEEKNDVQDRINELRKSIVTPIVEFKESLTGIKTAQKITNELYQFITQNHIIDNILNTAQKLENTGKIDVAEEYRAGIKIFFDVLDEIYMIFGEEKMSFDKYNKILQIGISNSEFGRIPTSFDQVLFGDINRSKTKEIKILFLAGLNDGVIPRIIKDEGFLNDKDRDILKENNIELAKNSIEMIYENQFEIYKALSTPEDKLYLSYSITDSNSNALRPSILITQIKKIFPKLTEKNDMDLEQNLLTTKQDCLDKSIEKYKEFANGQEIEKKWKDVFLWYKKNESKRIAKILKGKNFNNLPDVISTENIKKMYGNTLRSSVSRLEQYRRCPFSFHLKYGLKLKEPEEFKIRSIDTGNFMHEAIDEVFSKIEDKEINIKEISENELREIVKKIINEKLGTNRNYIFTSTPKFIVLTKRLKKVIFESINYIVKQLQNSKFELYGHELEFSEKSKLKPMKLELNNGNQVIITGKIDRVDIAKSTDNTFVRIIDYKSSIQDIKLNKIISGIQIQLLTYLDEITEQKNFDPAGILYFNLLDTIVKADKNLSDEEIKKQLSKKFKMKGLVVADVDIVKMMDTNLMPSTYSDTIPVYMDKEGNVSKSKSSALDREKFEKLQKYTKNIISQIADEIFAGNIDIKPYYLEKKTQCEYCEYKSICNFSPKFKNNDYRYIPKYDIEKI